MSDYDLLVIGGGPAGMMAAARAGERGRRVLLLERGPSLGRKLLITAGGRCNVTNSAPLPEFLDAFGRQGGFLRDAMTRFGNAELLDWLHNSGVRTVAERKGRIFPESQQAATVLDALRAALLAGGVEVRLNQRVESLRIEQGNLRGVSAAAHSALDSSAVLIATGGLSYPGTGCTGDGYALARQAGHSIVEPYPAIIAFETAESWPRNIQGTPIKNVSVIARHDGRKLAENFGEALWTHYGISGPAILDISGAVVLALRKGGAVTLELDLRPADTAESLDERLLHAIKKEGKKQISTVLAGWIAERSAAQLLQLAEVDPRKKMSQCSKSDRKRIVRLVKHLELRVRGHRPIEEAIVTGGGVPLSEVDPKRMESRLLKNLFFAGEVLDLAGPSGGYNLQAAFSTGYLVGESIG
ncbi:MAG: NAD(P)/FAD-dependent oxidoreductase [Candidatus Brocadiia bacterium]